MANKNTVDTAQKGQTTTKNNIPTGKVKTLANATERRKAREEQFRIFRINALKRRCKRYGFDDAKTAEYVAKLEEQMKAPKEYNIMVSFNTKDFNMVKEAVTKANIKYHILVEGNGKARVSYGYMSLTGDQKVLDKLREIAPPSAKIYPYAKKMESVIDEAPAVKKKKPTNNTVEKRKAAKDARKKENIQKFLNRKKGKGKTTAWGSRKISLAERKKAHKATTIQLNAKKSSTGSKKASTNLKKAA
jgi:dihydroorotate dehydrogenase